MVTISEKGRDLCLSISDNGCGFDLAAAQHKGGHLGLQSMQERIKSLGGQLKIHTSPGKGTQIVVEGIRIEEENVTVISNPQE